MKTLNRTIVSAILVSSDQKILLGRNRKGGVFPDCWHIPGGGVDAGETKNIALIREIKEEVGIDLCEYNLELISSSDSGTAIKTDKITGELLNVIMKFYVYMVNLNQNANEIKVKLNDDLVKYRWVEKTDLRKYKHTPPSKKLFNKLGWISKI